MAPTAACQLCPSERSVLASLRCFPALIVYILLRIYGASIPVHCLSTSDGGTVASCPHFVRGGGDCQVPADAYSALGVWW